MPALVIFGAIGVVLGSAMVLLSRDSRAVVIALGIVLVLSPVAAAPLPSIPALGFRVVAALLAAYLVQLGFRRVRRQLVDAWLGGATEAAFVGLAAGAGLLLGPLSLEQPTGLTLAAGLASGTAAVNLLLFGREPIRTGSGVLLAIVSAGLLRGALAGPADDLGQAAVAACVVAAATAVGWLGLTGARAGIELDMTAFGRDIRGGG
ncbi:MAG: hypothetical protein H0X16_09050 [Chloroflexi bacterium]|nr:hypothetical protein [Chloroflexota bacterium]